VRLSAEGRVEKKTQPGGQVLPLLVEVFCSAQFSRSAMVEVVFGQLGSRVPHQTAFFQWSVSFVFGVQLDYYYSFRLKTNPSDEEKRVGIRFISQRESTRVDPYGIRFSKMFNKMLRYAQVAREKLILNFDFRIIN